MDPALPEGFQRFRRSALGPRRCCTLHVAVTGKQGGIIQHPALALSPAGVVPRGIPEGDGPRRCQGVAEQGLLQLAHWQGGRRNLALPAKGGRQAGHLANVEDQGLEPGGAIGHVAAAEAFIGRQQVVDAGAD